MVHSPSAIEEEEEEGRKMRRERKRRRKKERRGKRRRKEKREKEEEEEEKKKRQIRTKRIFYMTIKMSFGNYHSNKLFIARIIDMLTLEGKGMLRAKILT